MLHDKYERIVCACAVCRAACKTMPGSLCPDDIARLADYKGMAVDSEEFVDWFLDHFVASDGIRAIDTVRLKMVRIGTIVPKQQESGACVFLDAGERCTIHAASPFACSHFGCTSTGNEGLKMNDVVHSLLDSKPYQMLWNTLVAAGCIATEGIAQRRAKFEAAIDKLTGRNRQEVHCDARTEGASR